MRVPLLINSLDASAATVWEHVETVLVSLHGGLLRTRQPFAVGDTLDIRMLERDRSARGRVVWMSSGGNGEGFELGFEILDPSAFWEIKFPPDRWSGNARSRVFHP